MEPGSGWGSLKTQAARSGGCHWRHGTARFWRALRPGWREALAFLTAMVLIAGPWYAVIVNEPGFASYFFWQQHVQRFVEPFDHAKPFWFYLPDLVAGTLPWSLLLVPLVGRLWRERNELRRTSDPNWILCHDLRVC